MRLKIEISASMWPPNCIWESYVTKLLHTKMYVVPQKCILGTQQVRLPAL